MESLEALAIKAFNEKFASFHCSPVKNETEGKNMKPELISAGQRLRSHYFRLKGCELENKKVKNGK